MVGRLALGCQLRWLCVSLVSAPADAQSLRGHFDDAKLLLNAAFAAKDSVPEELVVEGIGRLQLVAKVVAQGFRGNELTRDDEEVVQDFIDEKVFVLLDILPFVLMPPESVRVNLAAERTHPALRWQRVTSLLRVSWWTALTNSRSMWAVPLFGALASIAKGQRKPFVEDSYREVLRRGESNATTHLQALSIPLASWEYSYSAAFRAVCGCLALAEGRELVEAAERHYKAFEHTSLRAVVEHAAEWPVFDMLHSLARRGAELLQFEAENGIHNPSEELEKKGSVPADVLVDAKAGEQRMLPSQVLEMYRMLHVVASLFNTRGVAWWVSHGTLIGALRDGGLSRHADDCEIDVEEDSLDILQDVSMRRALARNGYELSYDPRGRCFKVWPAGSPQAAPDDAQLLDQTWWLPQQRVGTPALDVYVLRATLEDGADRYYLSNEEFHCNAKVCTQVWKAEELENFLEVPFGASRVRVPVGAPAYLQRAYGSDWNTTVRPHGWEDRQGHGFDAVEVEALDMRIAEPIGPLIDAVL